MINKLQPKTIIRFLLVLLLVAGALSLMFRTGLHYNSFSARYVIQVTGEEVGDVWEYLRGRSGLAAIDRRVQEASFQYISETDFNLLRSELQENFPEYEFAGFEQGSGLQVYANGVSFVLAAAVLLLGYVMYRTTWKQLDKQDRGRILSVLVVDVLLSALAFLGTLSLLSNVSMISEFEVFTALLAGIMFVFILFFSIRRYIHETQYERVDFALERILLIFGTYFRLLWGWATIAAFVLWLGLGVEYALSLAVFAASLGLAGAIVIYLSDPLYELLGMNPRTLVVAAGSRAKSQKPAKKKSKAKSKEATNKAAGQIANSSKQKTKKTKKKKSKKKRKKK